MDFDWANGYTPKDIPTDTSAEADMSLGVYSTAIEIRCTTDLHHDRSLLKWRFVNRSNLFK